MKLIIIIIGCLFIYAAEGTTHAQSLRSLNNTGVDNYKDKKFADAEVNFKKGLDKEPSNFISNFNLGDAYYQQQRYDEALNSYKAALSQAQTKNEKAKVYHNIGNSLLKSQQIKESIEAYKNSLKLNPDDEETKYNLSYALDMLKNQQKQNQDKNQQNQDQNKDQKQQQNQDKQKQDQQNKQEQQKQQDQKDQEAKQDATKQKQQENKISKNEAERILQALKNNEKDLQKKLRKMKGKPIKTDKDW